MFSNRKALAVLVIQIPHQIAKPANKEPKTAEEIEVSLEPLLVPLQNMIATES